MLALTLSAQTTVPVTGGDPGQGLTLNPANVLFAYNVNGTGNLIVQGVTFTPLALGLGDPDFSVTTWDPFPGQNSANDVALRSLFQAMAWDDDGGSPIQYTFSGLVPNGQYRLDVLQFAGYWAPREQAIVVNGSLVTILTLSQTVAQNTYFDAYADGSGNINLLLTQSDAYGGDGNQDGAIVNGLVLSEAVSAVPESSSYAVIAGASTLGLAWHRRRRSR